MPPKPKVTKQEIVDIAFDHVRQNGWDGLTARFLAEQLQTSTKPIYFHFGSMGEIEEEVVRQAMDMLFQYMVTPRTGDMWMDHAIGVVFFAVEEKYLWRAVFDEKRFSIRKKYGADMWRTLNERLSDYPPFQGLSVNQVQMIQRARWIFTHGYASLLNVTDWLEEHEPLVIHTIRRVSQAIYSDFKTDPEIDIGRPVFSSGSHQVAPDDE